MDNICGVKGLFVDLLAGSQIEEVIAEARALSDKLSLAIVFRFNGIWLEVNKDTLVSDKEAEYYRKLGE